MDQSSRETHHAKLHELSAKSAQKDIVVGDSRILAVSWTARALEIYLSTVYQHLAQAISIWHMNRGCTYLKIHHSRVVVVLTWEESPPEFSRVNISKWVIPCVPAAKASIKPSHTSDGVVNDTKLFMMWEIVYQLAYCESVEWYVGQLIKGKC